MIRPLPRAIVFAIIAMLLWTVVTSIISISLVGLPGSRAAAAEFQRAATIKAARVDLFVGPAVLFICGWLAARRFSGRLAVGVGLLVGLSFILLDLTFSLIFGSADRLDLSATALSYLLKIGGALLGGLLASRRSEATPDQP